MTTRLAWLGVWPDARPMSARLQKTPDRRLRPEKRRPTSTNSVGPRYHAAPA
ncbi:MAG: hypothetical protein QMB94_03590 [Phycisphaerales bacterium]